MTTIVWIRTWQTEGHLWGLLPSDIFTAVSEVVGPNLLNHVHVQVAPTPAIASALTHLEMVLRDKSTSLYWRNEGESEF